ncbi:MAG TPA: ABC transporter permease, partial [Candidatus Angelobacter sp.]|nr:ABC transporter permease [Candidatus Angelobacter sp.]
MNSFFQDLRYALRRLRATPGFTMIAVLTLALGIGANTAIFTVIDAVLLRPLPYRDPARLVLLSEHTPRFPILSVSYQNFVDWRDQSHSFTAVGAVRNLGVTLTGAGEPERLTAQMLNANVFDLLGLQAIRGRTFLPEEDKQGAPGVALISYGLWQRRFGGTEQILGQSLTLDNKPYSIVGVLPTGFQVLQQSPDIVLPFEPWGKTLPDDRSWHPGILPIARLKSDVTLEQARSEMSTIGKRLEQQYPEFDTGTSVIVNQMQAQLVENVRPALLMILGAVGFVLLIACTNVANLLLARATARKREIAVRTAIGASRWRVVRLVLTESVLLALIGSSLGLLLANAAVPPLLQLGAASLPANSNVGINGTVLLFTTLLAVVCGMLFGLAPALHMAGLDLRSALNETDRGAVGSGIMKLRGVLVVSEVALAMLLLVAAGLLIRSFDRLSSVAPGFSVDHILIGDLLVSPTAHPDQNERNAFFDRVIERAAALPGVRSAGAASFLPVSGAGSIIHFNIEGRPPKSPHEYVMANYRVASPGYLKTLGIPLLNGRLMTEADREGTPPVVVINTTMAKTFFPNESPLGKHLQLGATPDKDQPWMEIVGVVGDVKQSLASEAPTEMYVPYHQTIKELPVLSLSLVLRTAADPRTLAASLTSAVHEIDHNQPLVKIRTMEENLSASVAQPRFRTVLLAILAGLALLIAAVGIYGVMAFSVGQRTREIGTRMALGSTPGQIFKLVIGDGL